MGVDVGICVDVGVCVNVIFCVGVWVGVTDVGYVCFGDVVCWSDWGCGWGD